MSAPALYSRSICASVACASRVSVLVMDCTEIGAPPPTGTGPTMMRRDLRRACSGLSLTAASPVLRNVGSLIPVWNSFCGTARHARARSRVFCVWCVVSCVCRLSPARMSKDYPLAAMISLARTRASLSSSSTSATDSNSGFALSCASICSIVSATLGTMSR